MVVDVAELAEQVKVTAKTRDELEAMRKPVAVRVLAGSTGRERGAVAHGTVDRGAWLGGFDTLLVTLTGKPHDGVQEAVPRNRLEPVDPADAIVAMRNMSPSTDLEVGEARRIFPNTIGEPLKPESGVDVAKIGRFMTTEERVTDLAERHDELRNLVLLHVTQIESLQRAMAAIERRQMPLVTGTINGPREAQIPNLGTWVPKSKLDAVVASCNQAQRDILTVISAFRHDHNPKIVADAIIALGDVATRIGEAIAEANHG